MKKNKEPLPDFKEVEVKLKPLFGVLPQIYIPVVWGILIALILFFLLFFPGIIKNGTYVHYVSFPEKGLVYVDGKLKGTTPCEVFVTSGSHDILIAKPYYESFEEKENFKGSLFASLFFPLKKVQKIQLELTNTQGLVDYTKNEYSSWGMMKEFTKIYQFPPLLRDMAQLYQNPSNKITANQISDLIDAILPFVDSDSEAYDALNGFSRIFSQENPLDPVSMMKLVKNLANIKQNAPLFAHWLVSFLPAQQSARLKGADTSLFQQLLASTWFKKLDKEIKEKTNTVMEAETMPQVSAARGINGIEFIMVYPDSNNPFVMGNRNRLKSSLSQWETAFPHPVTINSFAMAKKEITNREYLAFVNETPNWFPSELDYLKTRKWADDNYLSHWVGGRPDDEDLDKPVTNISWFAAQAYCDWLEKKAGFNCDVRLPFEKEWEFCAYWDSKESLPFKHAPLKLFSAKDLHLGELGFIGLMGNTWEWNADFYTPVGFQLEVKSPQGSEKVVKGGSYMNIVDEQIYSSTRGSHPPIWSTEFLGFRPVYQVK